MSVFYQTIAHIFPGRRDQFEAVYHVCELEKEEKPVDTIVSKGDHHTLNRSFRSEEETKKFGRYLFARYALPNCLPPPTAYNLGLDLRLQIV